MLIFPFLNVDTVSNLEYCFSEGPEPGIQSDPGAPLEFGAPAALRAHQDHAKCHFYWMAENCGHPKSMQKRFTVMFADHTCQTWLLLSKAKKREGFFTPCAVTVVIFELIRAISGSTLDKGL